MEEPLRGGVVDRVRALKASAPAFTGREQRSNPLGDPKWAIGDELLTVPPDTREKVASEAGLDKGSARSYARVSEAWPPGTRTAAASWTTYRTLADREDRFEVIRPGMTLRDAYRIKTGEEIDRKAKKNLHDDELIDEIVQLMLSPRSKRVVPAIIDRLNASREGRRRSMDRRSTAALRKLDNEVRLVLEEMRRLKDRASADVRYLHLKGDLLRLRRVIEEIGMLHRDPDDRVAVPDYAWQELAGRLDDLASACSRIAAAVHLPGDLIDAEWVSDDAGWELPAGFEDVVDTEIVGDD